MSDLEVIIHREEAGGYWAEIPAMPGCFSDGATLAEVRKNIAEAAQNKRAAVTSKGSITKEQFLTILNEAY